MDEITISWRYPVELQVVVDVINYEPVFEKQNWRSGDQEKVTILDDRDGFVDMKFSNGFIAYHVEKIFYKEVMEKE